LLGRIAPNGTLHGAVRCDYWRSGRIRRSWEQRAACVRVEVASPDLLAEAETIVPEDEPVPFAGRYVIGKDLKRGNGVDTFLAADVLTGTSVVVKSIDPKVIHDAARLRFEHETQVLRRLSGPGLTGLHDAGTADDRLYLVQPLVPGRTLAQVLADGALPVRLALRIGIDVATALDAAHGAGVCHRDVKPANVIVDGTDVTLIDFGFARSPWLDESIRDELVGTVRYLAPEAAGLLAVAADERSDLYAVGVLLYECLVGRPPFPGPSVGDLLRQHLSMPVPEIRTKDNGLPRVLDTIVQRLLEKEPAARYQSAAALAFDLQALLEALEAGDPDPRLVVGRIDHRRTLSDPAFVGRDAELAALSSLAGRIVGGGSGLVLLEADSGGGKSRLLTEFALQAAKQGVTVLRGQGVAQAAQRPFTLMHGVASGLLSLAERDERYRTALVERVGDSASAVARALPSLGRLLEIAAGEDTGPEQFGEQRSLAALHHLLASMGDAEHPVLLVLDDCQWADRLTVRLLAEVFSDASSGAPHVGVVAAFRSEEVAQDDLLRHIPAAESVQLGPLPPKAMSQLAQTMAGPLPDAAIEVVVRLADGSPFMGAAVLRGLVESGALVISEYGWSVDEQAMQQVQTARRSAAFLVRRLELLSADALEVLSVGAVLGKEFDIVTAVELAGKAQSAPEILEEARARRLLWIDDRTGRCSFFHDKIRESLLARLDAGTRRGWHSRAADALLRRDLDGTAVFDLAYHLDAAGRHAACLPHALRAASLARAQHGLDSAVAHYRMALRGVSADDHAGRALIVEGLGDVLTLQGVYGEAREHFSEVLDLLPAQLDKARLDSKLGDLAFKQGDIPTARHHLEGGMARLGRPVPGSTVVLMLCLIWELLVQAAHTALPRLTGRRSPEGREADFLAMRIHSRLAYLYWFYSGKVSCGWSHLRGLNLAERYPPSEELGQAYSEHAPVMTMIPWFSRALRYSRRSFEIRKERGDVWGQGQSQGFAGVTLYAASRFVDAEEACREAIRLLESTGDQWEVNTAGWNLAMSLHRQGRLAEAADVAREVYRSATAIGDQTAAGVGLSVWARASGGRVDAQLIQAELDRGSEDASTTTELQLGAALQALHQGDLDRSAAHLTAATTTIRRAGLRQEYVAPVSAWRATVTRMRVEASSPHHPAGRDRLLRACGRSVLAARFWALSYRNNAPHALREAGLLASLRRRPRRAHQLLTRSLEIAEGQGAQYEAATTRHAIALVAQARGGSHAAVDEARTAMYLLEVPGNVEPTAAMPTASMFDRFTTLLSVGRTITAAPNAEALDSAIRDAALGLLRGERCHLINVEDALDELLTSESGEAVDEVSRTLVLKAVESGVPVVAGDPTVDESESLVLSGIRSVLAAPIVVNGETTRCFYVTHRQVGSLFGEEEVQLAAFVASLAGAAFEHLAGTETRFRSLGQNSSDVTTLLDRDGVVTYQSPTASPVFAHPEGDLIGQPVLQWVHPEDQDMFSSAIARAALVGDLRIECRFRREDGEVGFAETTVTNLLHEPTVNALVLNTRDITDRRRLEDQLRVRALYDSLTGLPNRSLFLERAERALRRREPRPLVACFLDLDDFKAVNDTHGHEAGDRLLVAIGERLSACLRPDDTVARLGGDEFAILLEDTDIPAALLVVDRILESTKRPVLLGASEVVIHTSIGLAPAHAGHTTPDQLLAEADAAMYAAKARGSHCVEVFEPLMKVAAELRSRIRTEINHALERDEFRLHYQPIVVLSTGEQVGVEALIRWEHPERGLLPPEAFIDHAEASGQITAMGAWVLATACSSTAHLPPGARMSVNVSARQLQQPDLVDTVAGALTSSGLAADRLVLEITETATVADMDGAIRRLAELRALGLHFALDDFGTGYSPLSHLRKLPVDYLKIDRSFVREIEHSAEDRAIVRGVIEMAHALGLATIAEGIEKTGQRDILGELGCDLGQGFLWKRPVPLEELGTWAVPAPRSPDQVKQATPR
jgi:diguanylate cyclase (GGDEF)-like protein/PAS domain S-box-containing protein